LINGYFAGFGATLLPAQTKVFFKNKNINVMNAQDDG
jgi:hypothetical protein